MILPRTASPGKPDWPTRPGPQPHNRIAPTAPEQLRRAHQPRPVAKTLPRGRRLERLEAHVVELERLVLIALVRGGRG